MPELTPERAIALLRERGGYGWLLDGPEAWDAAGVTENLNRTGISVTKVTVLKWFRQLPHTQDFGRLGLSASRDDLLIFFASRLPGAGESWAADGE